MRTVALLCLLMCVRQAFADEAHVAVAANFAAPAQRLAEAFSSASGHKLTLSSGSTGKFYAQIRNGAPFDVLLSADEETPRRLEGEKRAVEGTRVTYAVGRLALWGAQGADENSLRRNQFTRLAIANPRLAPYGAAARETLERLGLWAAVQGKIVQGENIAQAFQFVQSGNADLGFVALSQLRDRQVPAASYWVVPATLHAPLRQDAVLLARGARNAAARGFLEYLRSAAARATIREAGYEIPS